MQVDVLLGANGIVEQASLVQPRPGSCRFVGARRSEEENSRVTLSRKKAREAEKGPRPCAYWPAPHLEPHSLWMPSWEMNIMKQYLCQMEPFLMYQWEILHWRRLYPEPANRTRARTNVCRLYGKYGLQSKLHNERYFYSITAED
jgi:hypothetical protein